MSYTNPTIAQFQSQFVRDFPYGTDPNVAVLDTDIATAQIFAGNQINTCLFPQQSIYTIGFNLLTAHYLVLNLRNSSQGLNGQYGWAQNSKAVAGVSEGFEIPERIKANPELMMLTKTNYGGLYLQLALPYLTGQMFSVYGRTKP